MSQATENSVTQWLQSLNQRSSGAAERLWNRYFSKVVALADHQLQSFQRRTADGEDIAVSVFDTLIRGAANGQFSRLHDRRDLWCMLIAITKQKVVDLKRYECCEKRGGGEVRGDSVLNASPNSDISMTFDDLCGDDPTPDFLVALDEQHRHLLGMLRDDVLRQIAGATLEGYETQEIADRMHVSIRAVQRKLKVIRATWCRALVAS
jgi:DNA-directed RNA polymerase specialized sigma24 family protein